MFKAIFLNRPRRIKFRPVNKSLRGHRNILPAQDASSTSYVPWHDLARKDEKYFTSVLYFGPSVFPKLSTNSAIKEQK